MSLTLWVKATSTPGLYHILGKRRAGCGAMNYQIARDGGLLHFNSDGGRLGTGLVLQLDAYTHLAITYDGAGRLEFYVDGQLQASSSSYLLGGPNDGDLTIGGSDGCGNTFPGVIDELRIYDRAITAEEVRILARQLDTDGDGFLDLEEIAFGSDPLDPASLPDTSISFESAGGPSASVLNTLDPSLLPDVDVNVELTEAAGLTTSVLNTLDPTELPDTDVNIELTEASGLTTSVLNVLDPTELPDVATSVELTEAGGPSVSVLNALDPSTLPDIDVNIELTEASGAAVSVLNQVDPSTLPDVEVNVDLTEATGPTVSVLNEVDPTRDQLPGDVTLDTATGPVVTIENEAGP
jgi:hypothetical protein